MSDIARISMQHHSSNVMVHVWWESKCKKGFLYLTRTVPRLPKGVFHDPWRVLLGYRVGSLSSTMARVFRYRLHIFGCFNWFKERSSAIDTNWYKSCNSSRDKGIINSTTFCHGLGGWQMLINRWSRWICSITISFSLIVWYCKTSISRALINFAQVSCDINYAIFFKSRKN